MQQLDRIRAGIDRRRLQRLLVDAVNHYSPSYAEEPATRIFARAIEDAGLAYQRQPVPGGADTGGATRANLIVQLGPEPIELLWVGHVDTIAAFDEEHAHAQLDDNDKELLYGLGTADMKSGCAAAVEALLALAASGVELKRGLCLALVVGEEEYGDGAELLAEAVQAPLVVVGEPTGLQPCLDHYGYLEMELTCRGARAHAALPEVGSSAIHAMLVWMVRILEERREQIGVDRAGNSIAFNPRAINGGGDLFAVAEHCTAALDVHLAPQVEVELVRRVIEAARETTALDHPGCTLEISEEFASQGYSIAPDHPALEPLRLAFAACDMEFVAAPFRSHSDAGIFSHRGSLPLVCGPGRLEVAHTAHEHVILSEVEAAAHLYAAMFHAACL